MFQSSPFNPVSPQEAAITHLFIGVLLVLAGIFVLVAWLVTWNAIRYRRREGDGEPAQIFGLKKLEIAWTAAPILLLAVIFVFTLRTMSRADPAPDGHAPDILLISHQWWWEVRYPAAGVITANEIHLPRGEAQLLLLRSADVIHDFWVPQLGRKVDMIPGHPNRLWVDVTRSGTYLGACAEFCGAEHAWMRLRVIVQSRDQYLNWLRQQAETPAAPPPGTPAAQGQRLYERLTCGNCHAIRGMPRPEGRLEAGPDLTHLASRATLGAGVLTNSPGHLEEWMRNPQAVKPGCNMPNFHFNSGQVRELVAFLETLQ